MKKLILLLFSLFLPLSTFAQDYQRYELKVEHGLIKYNKDVKTLEVPFYAENSERRLNANDFLNNENCYDRWEWTLSEDGYQEVQIPYVGRQVKYGFVFVTFDLSELIERSYGPPDSVTLFRSSITNCGNDNYWATQPEPGKEFEKILTYKFPAPTNQIFGCTNPSSPNYNPQATDDDGTCQDSRPRPQNITGFFETTKVNHGATTWTMTLNTNIENAFIDISKIQTWNKFTPVSFYNQDKKIIITIKQFDDKRLDVECTNYELTIPKNALTTSNGDKNDEAITGNFIVENCPTNPANPDDTDNSGTGAVLPEKDAELNSQSTYMPLIFRKDGVFYLDFKAFGLMAFYFFLIFSFGYIIFKFFKR